MPTYVETVWGPFPVRFKHERYGAPLASSPSPETTETPAPSAGRTPMPTLANPGDVLVALVLAVEVAVGVVCVDAHVALYLFCCRATAGAGDAPARGAALFSVLLVGIVFLRLFLEVVVVVDGGDGGHGVACLVHVNAPFWASTRSHVLSRCRKWLVLDDQNTASSDGNIARFDVQHLSTPRDVLGFHYDIAFTRTCRNQPWSGYELRRQHHTRVHLAHRGCVVTFSFHYSRSVGENDEEHRQAQRVVTATATP